MSTEGAIEASSPLKKPRDLMAVNHRKSNTAEGSLWVPRSQRIRENDFDMDASSTSISAEGTAKRIGYNIVEQTIKSESMIGIISDSGTNTG